MLAQLRPTCIRRLLLASAGMVPGIPATNGLRAFSGACLVVATILFWRFLRRVTGLDTTYAGLALWLANPGDHGGLWPHVSSTGHLVPGAGRSLAACDGPAGPTCAGLAAATLAGLLTHNWFVFFLCGLGAMMIWQHGKAALRLAAPLAAGGALYTVVWGGAAWRQVTGSQSQLAWLQPPGWQAPLDAAIAHLWLPLLAAPLILVLVAAGEARTAESALFHRAALLGAAVTIALPLAVSLWKPVFNPRLTIVAAPFVALVWRVVQRGGSPPPRFCWWWVRDGSLGRQPPPACISRTAAAVIPTGGQRRHGHRTAPAASLWNGTGAMDPRGASPSRPGSTLIRL